MDPIRDTDTDTDTVREVDTDTDTDTDTDSDSGTERLAESGRDRHRDVHCSEPFANIRGF